MKANGVGINLNTYPQQLNFKSENVTRVPNDGHDEFVRHENSSSNKKVWWTIAGLVIVGAGSFFAHKAGWFKKFAKDKTSDILNIKEFKKVGEAKEYFEKLGIEVDFRGATDEHLPMLNRIKENLKQLKEMGVKKDKPDSIIISDWKNKTELEELNRNKGCVLEEYKPEFQAQTIISNDSKKHIFINSNKPNFDMFRHEMGHVNDGSYDSYWHSKGIKGHDFADNQLSILGIDEKVNRTGRHFNNIFYFHPKETNTSFVFPNKDMQTRFVHAHNLISKMQSETGCYAPELLHEQRVYVFEGLLKGKTFSDEVMLYYDFTGGARIPNLKINGMSYDDYIKSLYENKDLIEKLKANLQILKI